MFPSGIPSRLATFVASQSVVERDGSDRAVEREGRQEGKQPVREIPSRSITGAATYRWKVTEVRTLDNLVEEVPLRAAFLAACDNMMDGSVSGIALECPAHPLSRSLARSFPLFRSGSLCLLPDRGKRAGRAGRGAGVGQLGVGRGK